MIRCFFSSGVNESGVGEFVVAIRLDQRLYCPLETYFLMPRGRGQ